MPQKHHEFIDLPVVGASHMQAYVARPQQARAPGILVLPEAFGVNGHIRNICDRFAAEGYVAIAPELFHRTAARGYEGPYDHFAAVLPHYQAVTTTTMAADLHAAHSWLTSDIQVDPEWTAAVGFCMGGRAAFFANAILQLKAAVVYYGGGISPDLLPLVGKLHAPTAFFWGGKDAHIPPDARRPLNDAMHKAHKPFLELEFSEADHGFFCDERPTYHAGAARQSWQLTLDFLQTYLCSEADDTSAQQRPRPLTALARSPEALQGR